ncbi:hypothetical protein MJO28_009295 [Puccinia striiformis f. sp. tritici]|uniref:Uncharacterized protein n=1 Tax=Puccinia striiformis f. sp. tritici TaxID=168172 RepID=A0ACC0E814_9BASI|nr:hypothetical protein MJO28_009295 [Puccinia striiformis f. sp. tritici]KAI7950292.1 hypothetical protein MJO29_008966 [Puccinia striiformis f. sp. tritici]
MPCAAHGPAGGSKSIGLATDIDEIVLGQVHFWALIVSTTVFSYQVRCWLSDSCDLLSVLQGVRSLRGNKEFLTSIIYCHVFREE